MSSHTNRKNVENARRFLWDSGDTIGDAESGNSGSRSRRTNLSRAGTVTTTGFSTRDFNVVDQSVNLMDLGGDGGDERGGGADSAKAAAASAKQRSSFSGLFKSRMESENLNRFTDEFGDADAMNEADADEYIDGKRRRFFASSNLCHKRPRARAILTIGMAILAFVLIIMTLHSFELLELKKEEDSKTFVTPDGEEHTIGEMHKERYEDIQKRILDNQISGPNLFGKSDGTQKLKNGSPQQKALDWIVFDDPASLPHDHEALLDRYGLAVLYFSSTNNDDGWKNSKHWMSDRGICSWHGVECLPREQTASEENNFQPFTTTYNENNAITAIKLPKNHIQGTIPGELGTAFAELLTINLEGNDFTGTLPLNLSKGSHLRDLLVGSNKLKGTLPQEYIELQNLHQLDVSRNKLVGPIWFSYADSLTKLRLFSVSHNQLSGTFPDFSRMERLTGLFLEHNQLTGDLPKSLEGMTSLLDLKIGDNNFNGTIDVLSSLGYLETLHLANNAFSGTIPDMFDKLYRLHEVVLLNNKFEGTIPNTLTHLQALKTLNLDSNSLEGTLPPGLGLLTDVVTISLSHNKFEGSIPTLLGKLDDIKVLLLNHNKLEGPIPTELGSCFRLTTLHLQDNKLTGATIPSELGSLAGLSDVRLEGNSLEGAKMPPQICALRDDDLSVLVADCQNADKVDCSCCTECL